MTEAEYESILNEIETELELTRANRDYAAVAGLEECLEYWSDKLDHLRATEFALSGSDLSGTDVEFVLYDEEDMPYAEANN